MIEFLNYQPFGDHGIMSLLSIRMFHILLIAFLTWFITLAYKSSKQPKARKYYDNPNSSRNIHIRTQKDKSAGNHYGY